MRVHNIISIFFSAGSINQYASAIGSLWITYFLNILGRKNSLLFILLCYIIAWVLMTFCSFSMTVIYISRAFSGFAGGEIFQFYWGRKIWSHLNKFSEHIYMLPKIFSDKSTYGCTEEQLINTHNISEVIFLNLGIKLFINKFANEISIEI